MHITPLVTPTSVSGISVGDDIESLTSSLTEASLPFLESRFENCGITFRKVDVSRHGITAVAGPKGRIVRVSCALPYAGRYRESYFPGMTIGELRSVAKKLLLIHGMIVADDEFRVAFEFPETFDGVGYDDVDYVNELPTHMPVSGIHIQDAEWWR